MSYLSPIAARLWAARHVVQESTLAGAVSLVTGTAGANQIKLAGGVVELAPDGGDRDVILPVPGVALAGTEVVVKHGDGANALAIKATAAGSAIATLATAEAATVRCVKDPTSGWTWYNVGLHKAT